MLIDKLDNGDQLFSLFSRAFGQHIAYGLSTRFKARAQWCSSFSPLRLIDDYRSGAQR